MTTPESFERDQQALDPHRREAFEAAVEAKGGDLMVNMPESSAPAAIERRQR